MINRLKIKTTTHFPKNTLYAHIINITPLSNKDPFIDQTRFRDGTRAGMRCHTWLAKPRHWQG